MGWLEWKYEIEEANRAYFIKRIEIYVFVNW